jgi:hypothetical protein
MFRQLLAVSLLASLGGCNNSMPTSPADPSPPVPQSYVVSGIVSETVDGVSRPLAGHTVHLWISQLGTGRAQSSTTDHNGRYIVQVPKAQVFVSGWHPPDQQQPCLASAAVDKDTTIDVQFAPAGRSLTPPPGASPMITGVIYETTPQGRNPLRGVYVELDASIDVPVALTQTDDAGRFFLCRVNAPVVLGVGVDPNRYQRWSQLIPGTGDMVLEIELIRR